MTRRFRTSPVFIRSQLSLSGPTRVSHRYIHIFMRVITLRIVGHLNIKARQVQPNRYVIEITLMVVPMPPLDNHLAPHDIGR
jgi:hypothetical protein